MKYFYPSGVKFLFITFLFSLFIVNQSVGNKSPVSVSFDSLGVGPTPQIDSSLIGTTYMFSVGTSIDIFGRHLSGTTAVMFGCEPAASFTVINDTLINATMGEGCTGRLTVITPDGTAYGRNLIYFFPPPVVYSFSPDSGKRDSIITIKGIQFTKATGVTFGDSAAASFTIVNDSVITAKLGAGSSGSVRVTEVNGRGDGMAGFQYIYPTPPPPPGPELTDFYPKAASGGQAIMIKGHNLSGLKNVVIGNLNATDLRIISDSLISARVLPGSTGSLIIVQTLNGADTLNGFTYLDKPVSPVITDFFPKSAGQGDTVQIRGQNFYSISIVSFGNIPAAQYVVTSDTTLFAILYNGNTGNVTLKGLLGEVSYLPGFNFETTSTLPAPEIYDFYPKEGAPEVRVTIIGRHFTGVNSVSFGSWSANYFTIESDSVITAVIDHGGTGSVSVYAQVGFASKEGFTYTPEPTISDFLPRSAGKGDTVYITGHNFSHTSGVSFGGILASFTITSDTSIVAVVGDAYSGEVFVMLKHGYPAIAYGFTFLERPVQVPEIYDFSPKTGTVGTVITITGNHFTGTSSVIFGNAYVDFTVVSDSVIFATIGGGTPGVTTFVYINGTAGNASAYGFTFEKPANYPYINDFYPSSGGRGTVMTINGGNFTNVDTVTIGGTLAGAFTVVSDSVITATVGDGSSGLVGIRSPYGAYTTGNTFTYGEISDPGLPQITDFYPKSGVGGTVVTIYGHNLAPLENVTFGGTRASFYTAYSDSVAIGVVGDGSTGLLGVTNAYGTTYGSEFVYEMPKPEIYSFSPGTGGEGTTVYISGTTFTNISSVSFGGTPAASFIITADSLITATVGKGSTGVISVDSAFSSLIFNYINTDSAVVAKTITSYPNPSSGTSWVKHPVSANSKIRMIDMMGNLVKLVTVDPTSAQTQLDISDLKSGYYKVTWSNGSDTRTGTIVIQ
ncbi:T9SS type A sorting domain-containing protein [Chitinophaga oryziterrae]|uniref:T9SS type A sorting domain-containing protein n=1 Tax=Chitinophaga oryziterrae TaxID=1031224 RepID=A0A6N8JGL2_9BACT|nr:IPT/TIG domain-containing protein [Chitinophaga oryziterrae]MVT44360.1 T9SS type A sorting domain-containing protein [Chitinophaga oryziterrae]